MTTPQEQQAAPPVEVPPVDVGNALLGETPAQLSCALVQTPGGQRTVLTIRTVSTTQTVFLAKADADQWAASIKAAAGAMSPLILASAPGQIPGIGG